MKQPHEQISSSSTSVAFIKPSLSMTSLPPNVQHDGQETIKAKLRVERPYNSLKKKRNPERDLWRRSWGSGNSHSSCSLHSNATGVASSCGKDEFWAALQTNYNYIMDTNLLDTCKEARCEIEGATVSKVNPTECYDKLSLQTSPSQGSAEDPRVLRRWLRDMEDKLSKAPSLSEATQMGIGELQKRLAEHSVLYCEIVNHARVVSACIRATEKENATPVPDDKAANTRRPEGNVKGLEHRYHLIYLRAIEVQCLFEGLLGKKNSTSGLSRVSSTDTDDEPAAKLARLSDTESNTHASCDLLSLEQTLSDEIKSEDEDWPDLIYDTILTGEDQLNQFNLNFDADSEGSDCELITLYKTKDGSRYNNCGGRDTKNFYNNCRIGKARKDDTVLSENMDSSTSNSYNSSSCSNNNNIKTKTNLSIEFNNKINLNKKVNDTIALQNSNKNILSTCCCSSSTSAITTVSSSTQNIINNHSKKTGLICTAPATPAAVGKKRGHHSDISKFNRSNRKSKNCAIFYFKHLDTDNENFGFSSQGSDALKSGEDPSSEDEGWLYTNDCVDGNSKNVSSLNGDCICGDSDKENKEHSINEIQITQSINNMSLIQKDQVDSSTTICCIHQEKEYTLNQTNSPMKVDFELTPTKTVKSFTISSGGNSKNSSFDSQIKMEIPVDVLNKECSHESIKQLVLNAENLVRDEALRSPTLKRHISVHISSSVKKRDVNLPASNIQRIQEWLEHQPITNKDGATVTSQPTTDCEASGENTESDSASRESDTSEGFTDSIATCMQTGSNSQCTSTEIIGGSAEPITNGGSSPNLGCNGNVIRRTNRRSSDRPWSVSCLSQLAEKASDITPEKLNVNQGLANHSISESALHIISTPERTPERRVKHNPQTPVKSSDSKNSLKRRKQRRRRVTSGNKRSVDSGSDGLSPYDLPKITQTIVQSQSLSGSIDIIEDLTQALSMISLPKVGKNKDEKTTGEVESEEEKLMKPNFKLGPFTTAFMTNESKLGSLAALANYMNDDQGADTLKKKKGCQTGTEDHSSFSEQAWDNYQEKYNSENYSEGMDSDAARRLLEFGDDYRNFLDSQSDCCSSSLSAANNFDSLSPPRMDSLKPVEVKLPSPVVVSSIDHIRRRRALELEYERRRKSQELKKKNSHDDIRRFNGTSPHSANNNLLSPRNGNRSFNRSASDVARKLDFTNNNISGNHTTSTPSLRKTSESDNSIRRRKSEDGLTSIRRRSSRTIIDKTFKVVHPTSSSSNDDSDEEKEMKSLLAQSRGRLENTNALKIRSHLLRPEDYVEIIGTCRDNIRCLESVLRGPPGTVLSATRSAETRDLLSSWESLLDWSENASSARKMQEEMIVLKNALNRLGRQIYDFDSEETIQFAIEELKNEKAQLQTCRTNMLRLNASVHSWLTKREIKLNEEIKANNINNNITIVDKDNNNFNTSCSTLLNETNNNRSIIDEKNGETIEKNLQINTVIHSEYELHKNLKDEVSDMYSAWDEADGRISNHLEVLNKSWVAWRQLECGLSEFHQVLGKDRGTLKGLEGALERGQTTSVEIAQNVKQVAKLLSEKVESNQVQQQIAVTQDTTDSSRITPQFNILVTSSNGSLSDSGISDGGTTSDGGLSERERRLGVLRRLAKQLENALAPGSKALKSITARMEAAEAELKTLQNTCRELIVRTAVSQHKKSQAIMSYTNSNGTLKPSSKLKKSPQSGKRKNKRRTSIGSSTTEGSIVTRTKKPVNEGYMSAPDFGDPDDPHDDCFELCNSDDELGAKGGWAWRVARYALPMQIAILTLFCAACLMEPHCCDSLNNFSMSFTPQLRYVRGPPPI